MNEIQVWEHVLKWGLAQNPELPTNPTDFSKDDFKILKNTLQQCVPFVKFRNLTSKEFTDGVLPYKKILPKELYNNLLKSFLNLLDPNSKPNDKPEPHIPKEINPNIVDSTHTTKKSNLKTISIDSKIITYQHVELISKWIDKLEITDEMKNSYEFNLLFRSSRQDGFKIKKFHKICDKRSHTVTVAKVEGSDEILGGYNLTAWKSSGSWSTTKDSFIF